MSKKKYSYNERIRYHGEIVEKIKGNCSKKESYSLGFISHDVDISIRSILLEGADKKAFLAGEKAGNKAYNKALNLKQ